MEPERNMTRNVLRLAQVLGINPGINKAFRALSFTTKSGKFQKNEDEEYVTSMRMFVFLHTAILRRCSNYIHGVGLLLFTYSFKGLPEPVVR